MKPLQDITGRRFGRLTVVKYVGRSRWLCHCDCGGRTEAMTSNLNKGNSTSCGCKHEEARFKHGMTQTRQYGAWKSMLQRCENPNDRSYKNYGGRGIKVCDRWHEFSNFVADMGLRPEGFDIDRIDNNRDYRRNNRLVTWKGETLPITTWAERLGMNDRTLFNRINRGWSIERAMSQKAQKRTYGKKGN
jgi:hypothetical protein